MLKIKDISFGYTSILLFQKFSLSVSKGEICHIVGSNGAGKSTLLSMIAGLIKPQKGDIVFENDASSGNIVEYLAAEKNGLLLAQNAHANLDFWRRLSGKQPNEALLTDLLQQWQLKPTRHTRALAVQKFSTGMKRRLALVRVCYSEKPLWVLDEPMFGLDRQAQECLALALQKHLAAGGAAVLVTHQLDWLKNLKPKTVTL